MILGLLLNGTVLATVLIVVSFLLSRFTRDIVGRALLAIVLIIAALVYIVFERTGGKPACHASPLRKYRGELSRE